MSQTDIVSFGCRLNAYEGESIKRLAAAAGLTDAVVINSCAVTGEAVRQARQAVRRARRDNPHAKIVVTGCAAQIDPAEFARMPEVDAVFGNREKLNAADWAALAGAGDPIRVNDIFSVREDAPQLVEAYGDKSRAFLQVQNGCDHRCTFCIIPYGRGASRSIPVADVVAAAQRLAGSGHREIVLTGVDITSYGADLPDEPRLGDLVSAILDATPTLYRLRLSSIDGAEVDEELFARITGDARVAPHVHLSLQAGSDMILKRMKRRHTRSQAIEFCERIRARRPDVAFGADLIAGFPTETDEMFEESLRLVDDAGLQYLHVFPFSPREGTPAARMPQLQRPIIKARAERLRAKGEEAHRRFLDGLIGGTFDAVAESGGRARLGNFAQARLDGPPQDAGALARIRVSSRDGLMLAAEAA